MVRDEEFLKRIGQNIVHIRIEKGLKQIELASRLDMEESSIRRIEKGRVNSSIMMLLNISKALEVDLQEILK
jgi:transcriptional regulator with XRE-family HTH domain